MALTTVRFRTPLLPRFLVSVGFLITLALLLFGLGLVAAPDIASAAPFDLQAAINAAGSNSVINLPDGVYSGPFSANGKTNLTIQGGPGAVLQAPGSDTVIILRDSNRLVLNGFTVQGDYSMTTQKGIFLQRCAGVTILGVVIKDVGFSGIYAFPASNVVVDSVNVTHSGDFGVHFKDGSSHVTVKNSYLSGFASRLYPAHGIYFSNVTDATATGNYISQVWDAPGRYEVSGIKYAVSSGVASNNTVEDSVGGISLPGAYNTRVENNTVRRVRERGLFILAGGHDIVLQNNIIDSSARVVQFQPYTAWPYNVQIIDNHASNCGVSVDYYGGPVSMVTLESGNSWNTSLTTTTRSLPPTTTTTTVASTTATTTTTTTTTAPTTTTTTAPTTPTTAAPTTTTTLLAPTSATARVNILSPAEGSVVQGKVGVRMTVTSTVAVGKVRLYLDGRPIANDFSAPYAFTWDSRSAVPGSTRTITGVAYDKSGKPIGTTAIAVKIAGSSSAKSLLAAASPIAAVDSFFPDLTLRAPYGVAVMALAEAGVVSGFDDGSFGTGSPVTRAQFVKMVAGTLGIADGESTWTPFLDLDPADADLYPQKYIAALVSIGAVEGTSPDQFSPWDSVSRAQLASVAVRALRELASEALVEPPADFVSAMGSFDPSHEEFMRIAEYSNLLDGLFGYGSAWDPWVPASRGEVAQVLHNITILE